MATSFESSTFVSGENRLLLIDGKFVPAQSGKTFPTFNPSTGEVLARIAKGEKIDIDNAVVAARRAFTGPWAKMKPFERQEIILRFAELVDAHIEDFGRLWAWFDTDNDHYIKLDRLPYVLAKLRYPLGIAGRPTQDGTAAAEGADADFDGPAAAGGAVSDGGSVAAGSDEVALIADDAVGFERQVMRLLHTPGLWLRLSAGACACEFACACA